MKFLARYELKYPVEADRAEAARHFARTFCEPDAYGDEGRYEVDSLYLDTLDGQLADQTQNGIHQRFKVRLRTYGFAEGTPMFPEIKRRIGLTILKERGKATRNAIRDLIANRPTPEDESPTGLVVRSLMERYDLRPRVWVRYLREAWVSPYGDGARLTVDSALQAQLAPFDDPLSPDPDGWVAVPMGHPWLIELKFNGAVPSWMERLTRAVELRPSSFSKFVRCANATTDLWNRGLRWTA